MDINSQGYLIAEARNEIMKRHKEIICVSCDSRQMELIKYGINYADYKCRMCKISTTVIHKVKVTVE